MKKPAFITFTGIDAHTNLVAARQLAADYADHIEYGILFSESRQGVEPRYPSWNAIDRILHGTMPGDRFAAHLCGEHSRKLLATAETSLDGFLVGSFARVQVNTSIRGIDTAAIAQWAATLGASAILQCRDVFPSDEFVQWLFDTSGGRGISPKAWPAPGISTNPNALRGYAGGLNPDNVAAAVAAIGQHDGVYWIDMESGVRDANDRFDLGKCRAVCEAVYGAPK